MLPILRFYCLYLLGAQVGFSLLMLFARQAGYTPMQLAAFGLFLYATPVTLIPLLRRLPTRGSFALTLAAVAVGVGCLPQIDRGVLWYWGIAPGIGTTMVTFWVVYMVRHVSAGPDRANAYNSSVIVLVLFGVACISPLVAGQLGQRFGPPGVAAASLLLLVLAATQIPAIKPRVIRLGLRAAWPRVPAYARTLLVLQGMYEALQFLFLPLCTTLYLTEPMQFGAFFGAVAFIGSATNLLISRWSDRVGNRSRMIYLGCATMAVGAIGLANAENVRAWSVAALLLQTGFTLTLPYFIAVILDAVPDTDDALVVREWGCNAGRLATVLVAMALLRWTGNLQHAYFWGLIPLAGYPLVLGLAQRRGLVVSAAPHPELTAVTSAEVAAEGPGV